MRAPSVFLVLGLVLVSASAAFATERFPETRGSSHGGSGRAKIAFYVCRSVWDFGTFASAEVADASCAKLARARCPTCRTRDRQAAAAYGPYRYPVRRAKDDWYDARDYPYETLDGRQYSRSGYFPTP